MADGLGHKRHGARGTGVGLDDVHLFGVRRGRQAGRGLEHTRPTAAAAAAVAAGSGGGSGGGRTGEVDSRPALLRCCGSASASVFATGAPRRGPPPTWLSCTAYWMLMRPTTLSAFAILGVQSRMTARHSSEMVCRREQGQGRRPEVRGVGWGGGARQRRGEKAALPSVRGRHGTSCRAALHRRGCLPAQRLRTCGGMEHAESPLCTPACSMCCMMPQITTFPSSSARQGGGGNI